MASSRGCYSKGKCKIDVNKDSLYLRLIEVVEMNVPVKTREIQTNHFDSTKWNNFSFQNGDVVIATAYKSGTTWTQNILSYVLDQGIN